MQRVVITGANRGVGLGLVQHLAEHVQQIVATCRDPENAEELQRYASSVDNVSIVGMDVTAADSLAAAAKAIDGPVDLLVCNAGVNSGYGGLASDENALTAQAMDTFTHMLRVNVVGPLFTVQAFSTHLAASASAKIAIISSQMGSQQHEAANAYGYRASKAAVNNIMVTLSNELAAQQIAVAAYHPGWVRTDMGGPKAHLSVDESAQALVQRFLELDMSRSGKFLNYDGGPMPW